MAAVLAILASTGCVTSRNIVIRVADLESAEPIESAQVTVERAPVFAKVGAQSVPPIQVGLTDTLGQWHGKGANGTGFIRVSAIEYGEVLIGFGPDWRWPDEIQFSLKRSASSRVGPGSVTQ